tara:strand:+ start:1983 stop:2417 length:435 start_codon:yes stop_codon:yes gene_type:complete
MYEKNVIQFIVMTIVGMAFNPMNMLANSISDIFLSLTLFYGGLLMASNMMWAHEIIHYLAMGHFNSTIFFLGITMSLIMTLVLRNQLFVGGDQWLKRMIGHHSTAITTTKKLLVGMKNPRLFNLAKGIVYNQKVEILFMKSLLK